MVRSFRSLVALLITLVGCSPLIPPQAVDQSSPTAVDLLRRSASAHGDLSNVTAVDVAFTGRWLSLVTKLQPKLVDENFRGSSRERYDLAAGTIRQRHEASAGIKDVERGPGDQIQVAYNSVESSDVETKQASAIVADSYRMFVLGPNWLLSPGAGRSIRFDVAKEECIDGHRCDNVLAVLRPGLGLSQEDRVLVSIDRRSHLVRRYRFTLEGLDSTRGAVVDVFVSGYLKTAGVQWPTHYYEVVLKPVNLPAHRWHLTAVDVERATPTTMP